MSEPPQSVTEMSEQGTGGSPPTPHKAPQGEQKEAKLLQTLRAIDEAALRSGQVDAALSSRRMLTEMGSCAANYTT